MTRERADVLVRHALGAGARGDQRDRARQLPPLRQEPLRASAWRTPSRSPARTTAPVIASSSDGRPAAMSRAVEVVTVGGMASMISHCAAERQPDAVGRGDRARLVDRRLERGRQSGSLRSSPIGRCVIDGRGGERRLAGELLPQHVPSRSHRRATSMPALAGARAGRRLRGDRHHDARRGLDDPRRAVAIRLDTADARRDDRAAEGARQNAPSARSR